VAQGRWCLDLSDDAAGRAHLEAALVPAERRGAADVAAQARKALGPPAPAG